MPHGTLFVVICPPPQSLPPIPARHLFQGLASQFLPLVLARGPFQGLALQFQPPILVRSPFQGLALQFLPPVLTCGPFQGLASQFLSPVQKTMLTALSDHSFVQRDTGPVQLFAATQVFRLKFLPRRKFFASKPCVVVAVTNPGAVAKEC